MRALVRPLLARLIGAALGATLLGAVSAALDARVATGAAGAAFGAAFLPVWGLWAPLAFGVGVAVGVALVLLVPEGAARRWLNELRSHDPDAARLPLLLAPLALVSWLVVSARLALRLLSSELEPALAGASIGLATALLAVILVLALAALARAGGTRMPASVSPAACLAAGSLLAALWLGTAIVSGEPSGSGGPLSVFGVLRREELDLRPVGWVALIVAGAAFFPALRSTRALLVAAAVCIAAFGSTWYAAGPGLDDRQLAVALERSAPLASRLLPRYRKLSDGDGDGFSASFGGGDCDDASARRSPGADDLPGNGVDEDCSGSDARVVAPRERAPAAPQDMRAAALAALPEKLNVVLISIDTLRYDLGYMGHPRPISPRLDELAKESTVFERAYALASYTAKSLPPMLIGKYAGETRRDYAHFNRFGKEDLFVAERLQRARVRTLSVQGHWYFFKNFGMERGFDVVNSDAAPRAAQAEGDRTSTSDKLSDAALAVLGAHNAAEQPFFLWVHYTDPHAEYVRHDGFDFGTGSRAAYESEVAFVDHHVGRVLDALRAGPHWQNTAVIVTSDHGEAFGEHGMIRHGFELWEELVRVPLLVRVPGFAPHRLTVPRSLIDVVPTVLDLFRAPAPSGEGNDFLSGQSLLLDVALPAGYTAAPRPIFVDMVEGPHNAERRALIDGDLKIVTSGGRLLGLYDLAADPDEKRDLAGDRQRASAALDAFRAFRSSLREFTVRPPR